MNLFRPDSIALPRRRSAARYSLRNSTVIALATTAVLAAAAPPARGQGDTVYMEKGRTPRAKSMAVVGAIVGLGLGLAIGSSQKPPAYSIAGAGLLLGGLGGFLLGKQYDEIHAVQFRGVRPLTVRSVEIDVTGDPIALSAGDSTVDVGTTEGVQTFFSSNSLLPGDLRARGLIGITTVAVTPHTQWLTVGTGSGLYLFPPRRGRGVLVHSGAVAAVVATGGRVISASGGRVIVTPVNADSELVWPGVTLTAPVRALALDSARAIVWAATDDSLFALRLGSDSLTRLAAVKIEGGARKIAAAGTRVAVAVGERGVRMFDVTDAAHPVAGHAWTVARFAYDVSLAGDRMFVAAGPDGVYVVDLKQSALLTIGVARDLGFAAAIVSADGYTYLLDGRTNVLRRLDSDF
jgi:hypothetical protein